MDYQILTAKKEIYCNHCSRKIELGKLYLELMFHFDSGEHAWGRLCPSCINAFVDLKDLRKPGEDHAKQKDDS